MEFLSHLEGGVWYLASLVIAISVIVAIHEFGHYIVGRWTGIHAEIFSVGFGPVLVSRTDRRGTRWQVAAIPLGGYVRFLGDADASSVRSKGVPNLPPPERRRTMEGAPLWARALTVIAGPAANFVLTFALLAGLLVSTGIVTEQPTISGLVPLPAEQPLRKGDRILAMNGQPTTDTEAFANVLGDLPRQPLILFTVERNGQKLDLEAPHPQPALIAAVQPKSAAIDAGLHKGDLITRAGGRDIVTFADLQDVIFASDGQPVPLTVWRDGQSFDLTLVPRARDMPAVGGGFERKWMIGISSGLTFDLGTRAPSLWETISRPLVEMWSMTVTTFSGLYNMIIGQISACGMSGPVGIAEAMGDAATTGAMNYLSMLAILSLGIGILNMLPIPILDGGHLIFIAYEAVAGRPPSEEALRFLMAIGLTLLISLMAYSLFLDLTCI